MPGAADPAVSTLARAGPVRLFCFSWLRLFSSVSACRFTQYPIFPLSPLHYKVSFAVHRSQHFFFHFQPTCLIGLLFCLRLLVQGLLTSLSGKDRMCTKISSCCMHLPAQRVNIWNAAEVVCFYARPKERSHVWERIEGPLWLRQLHSWDALQVFHHKVLQCAKACLPSLHGTVGLPTSMT